GGQLQDQVPGLARGHGEVQRQHGRPPGAVRLGPAYRTGPAHVQVTRAAGPYAVVVAGDRPQAAAAETGPQVQRDLDLRGTVARDDLAQHDHSAGLAGKREGLAALGDTVRGDPAAAPDQGAFLVVAAPDERAGRGDGVDTLAADQGGEDRVRVPPRGAHPHDVAARADDGAALPVGDQG